jgi:DNA repair protein RadD
MIDLRPFQLDAIAESNRHNRPMIVAPTGSGKTVIAAEIIRRAENKFVLFLAHRRELIHQTRGHLADFGVKAGVILAGEPMDQTFRVQVASIQTLSSRCMRGNADLPSADIVFIDEAHHCTARTYVKIIEAYPDVRIIGLTATPCRRDGRGLGSTFNALVECPQIEELIELGFLVRTKVFAPSTPDLKGVHTRHGDYVESELAARIDRPELVGDIVTHWHRLGERRKTVVFATSVAHSIHLKEEFVKSSVRAEHIDGQTPKEERDEILKRLSSGDLELVTNCMVLTEGWDQPDVSWCVLARPTKSMGLYRQMAGRVIRPATGKTDAIILDHAGAVFMHGFIEDPVVWTLRKDKKAETPIHETRKLTPSNRLLECSQCSAMRTAGKSCPNCGFMPRRPGEYLYVIDGDLAHVERNGAVHHAHYSVEQKREFHAMLVHLCLERGHKLGAAAHRFKARFGHWPVDRSVSPLPPNAEVIAWDRHCRIRYAKRMQKAASGG